MFIQQVLVVIAGVLAAAIAVMEQARRRPAIAVANLDSPGVKGAAAAAAVAISEKVIKRNPAAVAKAMKRVLEARQNAELTTKAKRLMRRASEK